MRGSYQRVDVNSALAQLDGWQQAEGREALQKTYGFANFNEAFGFMTRVAMLAESMNHHPEWKNIYNRVEVELTTHDAQGVTDLDLAMARFMDQVATALK